MDKNSWNQTIKSFSYTSILQTWEWGELKKKNGWERYFRVWNLPDGRVEAAAMILAREQKLTMLGPKVKILYVPHGPLLDWKDKKTRLKVLTDLKDLAQINSAVFIKIDPQVITAKGIAGENKDQNIENSQEIIVDFHNLGWLQSPQQIQFKNTFWLDLSKTEKKLLSDMKQKTRYNIRLAVKKGVKVRELKTSELEIIYRMYAETAIRDEFIIRPKEYYLNLWSSFMEGEKALPLIAEVENEPVAGLFLFYFADRSYYLYGMSIEKHREKMPNYLLQWEAIKRSKALGCRIYDLWGAPDVFDESDRMWGVHRFKDGLGGKVIQTIGAYDYPVSKFQYRIFQGLLPKILAVTRKFRRRQIKSDLEG